MEVKEGRSELQVTSEILSLGDTKKGSHEINMGCKYFYNTHHICILKKRILHSFFRKHTNLSYISYTIYTQHGPQCICCNLDHFCRSAQIHSQREIDTELNILYSTSRVTFLLLLLFKLLILPRVLSFAKLPYIFQNIF